MDVLVDSTPPYFDIHSNHDHHNHHANQDTHAAVTHAQVHSMSMPMYFQWGTDVTVLFEQWHVESPGWYTVTAVAIFLLGLLYEWLITFRQGYEQRIHTQKLEEEMDVQYEDEGDLQASQPLKRLLRLTPQHQAKAVNENLQHLVAAALHVIQLSIAYALMLIVMTYNVGLSVAVIAGAGAGYFLFARLRRNIVINEAGCH